MNLKEEDSYYGSYAQERSYTNLKKHNQVLSEHARTQKNIIEKHRGLDNARRDLSHLRKKVKKLKDQHEESFALFSEKSPFKIKKKESNH